MVRKETKHRLFFPDAGTEEHAALAKATRNPGSLNLGGKSFYVCDTDSCVQLGFHSGTGKKRMINSLSH